MIGSNCVFSKAAFSESPVSSTWFSCFCDTDILCFYPLGSLCSSIFDPHSALVGASGGVYALIGGYFMNAVVVGFHIIE